MTEQPLMRHIDTAQVGTQTAHGPVPDLHSGEVAVVDHGRIRQVTGVARIPSIHRLMTAPLVPGPLAIAAV
jgi:hypothetical protein